MILGQQGVSVEECSSREMEGGGSRGRGRGRCERGDYAVWGEAD